MGENCKVCKRSAQSMAEHFKKQIMQSNQILGLGLDQKIVSKFRRGFEGEEVNDTDQDEESEDINASGKAANTPREMAEMSEESDRTVGIPQLHSPERKTRKKKLFSKQHGVQRFTPRAMPALQTSQPTNSTFLASPARGSSPRSRRPSEPSSSDECLPPPKRSTDEESEPIQGSSRGISRRKRAMTPTSDENSDDSRPGKGIATSSPKNIHHLKRFLREARKFSPANESEDESPALFVSPKRSKPREKRPTRRRRANSDLSIASSTASSTSRREYTASEDRKIEEYVRKNGLYVHRKGNAMWVRMQDDGVLEGRSWQSMKNRFLKSIAPKRSVHHFKSQLNSTSSSISSIKFYTAEEDKDILRFIVENNRINDVKGNALWELMEQRGVADGRSHQSMKERFRKTISKNIENYEDVIKNKATRKQIRELYA